MNPGGYYGSAQFWRDLHQSALARLQMPAFKSKRSGALALIEAQAYRKMFASVRNLAA